MADPPTSFIPKSQPRLSAAFVAEGGAWLFNIALLLFVASAVGAGGLYLYRRSLASAYADWREQVVAQEAEFRPEFLAQFTDLSSALASARVLLAGHVYASSALLLVESLVHPSVSFNSLSFSRNQQTIELSGAAKSYQAVAEQIRTMEGNPQVESVEFGGLARSERGVVSFRLTVHFKPSLLELRSQ